MKSNGSLSLLESVAKFHEVCNGRSFFTIVKTQVNRFFHSVPFITFFSQNLGFSLGFWSIFMYFCETDIMLEFSYAATGVSNTGDDRSMNYILSKYRKVLCESNLSSFLTLEMWKYFRALVVLSSLMVVKCRVSSKFFTFSNWRHYLQKVILDWNGQAILSSIVFYLFGLERHKHMKRAYLEFSFRVFFKLSKYGKDSEFCLCRTH